EERRAYRAPGGVLGVVRDHRFERRDRRALLERVADGVETRLQAFRLRRAPFAIEAIDGGGIDVGRGGDAPDPAALQGLEKEPLAAREHLEAVLGEGIDHRPRIGDVAGAVLYDTAGVRVAGHTRLK